MTAVNIIFSYNLFVNKERWQYNCFLIVVLVKELFSQQNNTYKPREILLTIIGRVYYGSEVWHLPERTANQNKMIKYASANALRTITNEITIFHTHTQIHTIKVYVTFYMLPFYILAKSLIYSAKSLG